MRFWLFRSFQWHSDSVNSQTVFSCFTCRGSQTFDTHLVCSRWGPFVVAALGCSCKNVSPCQVQVQHTLTFLEAFILKKKKKICCKWSRVVSSEQKPELTLIHLDITLHLLARQTPIMHCTKEDQLLVNGRTSVSAEWWRTWTGIFLRLNNITVILPQCNAQRRNQTLPVHSVSHSNEADKFLVFKKKRSLR